MEKKYKLRKSFIKQIKKQYSNRELARKLGYDESTTSLYMNEKRVVSRDFILQSCFIFKMDINQVVKRK